MHTKFLIKNLSLFGENEPKACIMQKSSNKKNLHLNRTWNSWTTERLNIMTSERSEEARQTLFPIPVNNSYKKKFFRCEKFHIPNPFSGTWNQPSLQASNHIWTYIWTWAEYQIVQGQKQLYQLPLWHWEGYLGFKHLFQVMAHETV